MIQIKKNDYTQPTEVREEVVQGICEAFLTFNACFHPCNGGRFRSAHIYIVRRRNESQFYSFDAGPFHAETDTNVRVRFNGAEMKRAFAELINAGYYMFRVYRYGSWIGYICSKKPYVESGLRVDSFDEFID